MVFTSRVSIVHHVGPSVSHRWSSTPVTSEIAAHPSATSYFSVGRKSLTVESSHNPRRSPSAALSRASSFLPEPRQPPCEVIPDAEEHVGIKNVGNKDFLDAVSNASGNASGKQSFPMHHEGVDKNPLRKGGFPTPHETSRKGFNERREFPFSRCVLRDFPTPLHWVGKFLLNSFQFCKLQNQNREEKRKEKKSSRFLPLFCRCSAAVRRRCPSPPSVTLAIMSYRRSNFMKTDDMFFQFEDDLDNNIVGGSSSVGDNTAESSSQQTTPTPRKRAQSRLLELERHVAINGRIPMTIAPGAEKPISLHAVRFSQAIGVCVRKTFPVRCLKWVDVGREYIEVRLFVLDFNDQAMNRFVEHQMLITFKEFRATVIDISKSTTTRRRLMPTHQTHWLDVMRIDTSSATIISAEQSWTNKAARQKQPYNHSSGSKSFLQRQYELAERKRESVDRVELFWETHVRAGTFVSQAAEDAHNQMLELQSQPTPEGSQPLSEDEICDQVLGRRPGYSKGLGWGPKPKARRTASASSSSTSCSQSTENEIELQAKLQQALERIEVQDRNHQALASQVKPNRLRCSFVFTKDQLVPMGSQFARVRKCASSRVPLFRTLIEGRGRGKSKDKLANDQKSVNKGFEATTVVPGCHSLSVPTILFTYLVSFDAGIGTMSFPNGFDETDASFDFDAKTFNNVRETSSVDDMSDTSQLRISTPRRRQHSKNLELKRYVHQNGKILISIALGWDKSISPHVIR
ncbi:CACTA en-spm transposon protein [Cucumis melo var. makuwa]|uniref:CACTA en-spm transposon protein n=1 Tax=Cucumis melo var. makuwa TaxID=1194695 RepID=A0A5D3CCM0_CUCMM|nr:CACTA en-spm transposon protein [Cucumis melo var. makuwa]